MTPFHLRDRLRMLVTADDPVLYCRELVRKSRSNFSYAFLFLPRDQKEAMEAVYAFCRVVDDAGDVAASAAALDAWEEELGRAFGTRPGTPITPIGVRLAVAAERFGLPLGPFERVVAGVRRDLLRMRYRTFDELRDYCEQVASSVGLVCVEIFGHATPIAKRYAAELGVALQLTNILRDIAEDARAGRIYLPLDDLERFGVSESDLLHGLCTPGVRRLVEFEIARARDLYREARGLLSEPDRQRLFVAEIMADIYWALLDTIEQKVLEIMADKPRLHRRRKLALAMRRWIGTRIATA
jgi:phytoene synthase